MAAELTYIDLTENNVYYAANHNQGVEHIPGVAEIALSEGRRVGGRVRSEEKINLIFTLEDTASSSIHNKLYTRGGKNPF